MRVAALLLGAGRGERLGREVPKAFVPLAGRPLIEHALWTLAGCDAVDLVVPVLPADLCQGWQARHDERRELPGAGKLAAPVAGGITRQDSVRAGLDALPDDVGFVAVHDAARPLLRAVDAEHVIAAAREHGAALLATPVTDTIKRVRDGRVLETPPRSECWAAQTPQAFRVDWLRQGLEKAAADGVEATDCSQLVEALGMRVVVVRGDPGNTKITDAADLARVEAELAR